MPKKSIHLMRFIVTSIAVCLATSSAFANEKLPAAASMSLEALHPHAKVNTTNLDQDGIYQIDLNVNQNRFLVELTRSGRVVSNKDQGKVQDAAPTIVELPVPAAVAIKKHYPQGTIDSVIKDEDGIYHLRIRTPQGLSYVETTKSGRILKNNQETLSQIKQNNESATLVIQHIESAKMLPANILATIEAVHPLGTIAHVYQDPVGSQYGRSAYYAMVIKGDKVYNVGLSENGKVLKNVVDNRTQKLKRLPLNIKNAVQAAVPNGLIYSSDPQNGIYELDVLVDGQRYDLHVNKAGQIISKERNYQE